MGALRIAIARLRALFRRDATTDEIREELQFHVEMRTEELARKGLEPAAARQAAVRRFGNPAVIQDRGYDVRGGGVMETMLQDVKYTLRQLSRQPSFAILSVITLALGIGVSTALFSVIDAALLRPLPYPHPEELVTIDVEETTKDKPSRIAPSMADIRAWRALDTIVSQAGMGRVAGFVPLVVDSGTPQRLTVASASEGFLETYGITPILGRGVDADDTREGAPRVALLGHAYWQGEFGGDPNVVGRSVRIQNEPVTIIGVLPRGFYQETAVWQASQFPNVRLNRRGSGTPVIARLRPGVTIAQARAAFETVTAPSIEPARTAFPVRVVMESMYDGRDQRVWRHDSDAVAGSRPHPPHRVCQRRGSVAGSRCDSAGGAGDPGIHWGRARSTRPSTADRERGPGRGGCARWSAARVRVARRTGCASAARASCKFTGGDQRNRSCVRARTLRLDGPPLWSGAGIQALSDAKDDDDDAGGRWPRCTLV